MLTIKRSYLKDKKIKIDYRIESFFEKNKKFLEENYPGIQVSRLQEEFSFYQLENKNHETFFNELKKGKPLEYITRHKYFYNSDYYVDERVLIPRYDSESMVFDIIESCKKFSSDISFCEVGVGSGCLSLSILKETPNIKKAVLTDISSQAMDVCKINAKRHESNLKKTEIHFHLGDRLESVNDKFDIIISNPPYIAALHKSLVHKQVDSFEPFTALYLPDDSYLKWFEVFFKQVYDRLNSGGFFFMEGHELKLLELQKMSQKFFSSSEIKKDLTESDRYLKIKK